MNILKVLGEATALSTTPSNIDSGEYVLLQHNHAGGNAHLVTQKDSGGTVLGSLYVAPHRPIIIKKGRTDTLEVGSGVSDIYGTSVVHMG
jgi:hypothetical protein